MCHAVGPIVQTEIPGEKVSIYNERNGDPRPRLAVSLANETDSPSTPEASPSSKAMRSRERD
jgi:hypothetical protein